MAVYDAIFCRVTRVDSICYTSPLSSVNFNKLKHLTGEQASSSDHSWRLYRRVVPATLGASFVQLEVDINSEFLYRPI